MSTNAATVEESALQRELDALFVEITHPGMPYSLVPGPGERLDAHHYLQIVRSHCSTSRRAAIGQTAGGKPGASSLHDDFSSSTRTLSKHRRVFVNEFHSPSLYRMN